MHKIFISYRRADSYEAHRLTTSLRNEYGENNIFLDSQSITGGEEWPDRIRKSVSTAAVLMVVIGKNWLFIQDEDSGKRKIDMENDWVRREIIIFLKRLKEDSHLLLIPILINGAKMPNKEHLGPEIRCLCDFQAIELSNTMSPLDFVKIKHKLVEAKIFPSVPLPVVTPIGEIPPDPLTEEEEERFLLENVLWQIKEQDKQGSTGETMRELYRIFEFENYAQAWKYMCLIHEQGVKPHNHHPRWQNTYNRVEVWLCTFNIGHKPSKRDLRLAEIMEHTWQEFKTGLQQCFDQE
jgi:pterin-4a-carbinolamine dehydratase